MFDHSSSGRDNTAPQPSDANMDHGSRTSLPIILCLLTTAVATPQTVVTPDRLPAELREFDSRIHQKLACRVSTVPAALDLGFRFQTGFTVEAPLRLHTGAAHRWSLVLRVTPDQEATSIWLYSEVPVAAVPDAKAHAEVSGSFLVGEGRYRVELRLTDEHSRTCSKRWTVRAKLGKQMGGIRPGLPAGAVDDRLLSRSGASVPRDLPDTSNGLSILLNASPIDPGRVRLSPHDKTQLLSALLSVAERVAATSVRVSVFSLDLQREIYQTASFTRQSFVELSRALNAVEFGIVDFNVLQRPTGHRDFFAALVRREMQAQPQALIVLGPVSRWTDHPARFLYYGGEPRTVVYNLQIQFPGARSNLAVHTEETGPVQRVENRMSGPPLRPDLVEQTAAILGGHTRQVHEPEDLAEAIAEINNRLAGEAP